MKNHLTRRGGIWWARLVVPGRLRAAAGRCEFTQSCKTHELQIAKLVAAILVSNWRRQLLALESRPMSLDVLKLVDGAPEFVLGGLMPLGEASARSGIPLGDLLRSAATGGLTLHCRLRSRLGFLVQKEDLEPIDIGMTGDAGVVVPGPGQMPEGAIEYVANGEFLVHDGAEIAQSVLGDTQQKVVILLFDAPGKPGWVFAPNDEVKCEIVSLEVPATEVDGLRRAMAASISAGAIDAARAARAATSMSQVEVAGKWAQRLFTGAVKEYCARSDGLRSTLASEHELRHREQGLMLFAEFMGDKKLGEIDGDLLRAFRDGPLKEFPNHAARLPKALRRANMRETIQALKALESGYEPMTAPQRQERMRWLFRLFEWLRQKDYLAQDPATSLRGEDGMSKAERVDASRQDDDEEGRREFSDTELGQIFSQRHFQTGNGSHVVKKNQTWYPFEYWLPLLGLYGGCRIKEASQLHLDDVAKVDGVWCLDLNHKTADKSLKTDASTRRVPIHAHLIKLGFLDYCVQLQRAGYRRVFPELTYSSSPARYAKEPIRKMSAMLEALGMPRDGTLVYHCLRHNLNNALMRVSSEALASADEKLRLFVRYRVMGHALPQDVNARHYTTTKMKEMADLVNSVRYELPKIVNFDIEHGLDKVKKALGKKMGERCGREDMGPLNDGVGRKAG